MLQPSSITLYCFPYSHFTELVMEELALKPLKRHRNKRQHSLLVDDDWEEVQTLISDDDDQVNSKSAYHRRWRYQSCPKRLFEWTFNGGWKIAAIKYAKVNYRKCSIEYKKCRAQYECQANNCIAFVIQCINCYMASDQEAARTRKPYC